MPELWTTFPLAPRSQPAVLTASLARRRRRRFNTPPANAGALSFSEEKEYDDQIVIVDGIGITHFIPRRAPAQKAAPAKKQKKKKERVTAS
jgi:hypothetical protein